jgi:hypothetical protein
MGRRVFLLLLAAAAARGVDLKLPLKLKSVRFALIGDSGTSEAPQYQLGRQMADCHGAFPFDFVLMLGDNLYGRETPADFKKKFEDPYKALLDAGVKFYASLGNHDNPNQRLYKLFNMDGKRYYTFKRDDVQFFSLDRTYMHPTQLNWLDKELSNSSAAWKICFFHHPLYSNGRMHGADVDLRAQLEPIFKKRGMAAVFSGHDHVYKRLKPQNGIYYTVLGRSGQLREHDLKHRRMRPRASIPIALSRWWRLPGTSSIFRLCRAPGRPSIAEFEKADSSG